MIFGFILDCVLDGVLGVGNVVGMGVCMVLFNCGYCCEIEEMVYNIEKIEIVFELKFQEYFVNVMVFLNKVDLFVNLWVVVDLLECKELVVVDGVGEGC